MCESLAGLRNSMTSMAAEFDPALVSAADAARVVDDAAAIEKMAATVKALAAARVAETSVWRSGGDRSAAHHLARTTGTTVSAAPETINAARRFEALPRAAAAARAGELSGAQVAAITEAAGADPSAEARLVEAARRSSLQELRDACASTKAAATADAEARRRRIHQRRCLRTYTNGEGAANLHMRDNPEVVAGIMAAVSERRDRLFARARAEGRREPTEAYAADALAELVRDASSWGERQSGKPGRAKIIVRVDLPALLGGYPSGDEVAELVGYGPVPVSAIRDMIDSGDPFLAAVATTGIDVVGVAHLGRRPTAHQQTALEWLYPACAVEGCNAVARLEMDHREDWATTHVTLLSLIDRLCSHHHALKTRENWALVEGRGKRALVSPIDVRHPRNWRSGASRQPRRPVAAREGPAHDP